VRKARIHLLIEIRLPSYDWTLAFRRALEGRTIRERTKKYNSYQIVDHCEIRIGALKQNNKIRRRCSLRTIFIPTQSLLSSLVNTTPLNPSHSETTQPVGDQSITPWRDLVFLLSLLFRVERWVSIRFFFLENKNNKNFKIVLFVPVSLACIVQ